MRKNMIELSKSFSFFWIIFVLFALTYVDGQYSNFPIDCNHRRLQQCQQDMSSSIQEVNSQSYSGISSGYQNTGHSEQQSRCSSVRQSLDCLIMYTPPCLSSPSSGLDSKHLDSKHSSVDFIHRGRRYLERECEQGGTGWRSNSCYLGSDIKTCESQHNNQISTVVSSSSCRNFQNFRDCVIQKVRRDCRAQDLQLMGTYLIDKGQELSWSCTLNADYGSIGRSDGNFYPNDRTSNGGYNNQPYQGGVGQHYGSGQPYGSSGQSYGSSGQQYGSGGQPYSSGSQPYGTVGQQYGNTGGQQYGSGGQYYGSSGNQIGTQYDSNQQQSGSIDRGLGFYPTTDSCLERAGYFVRSCEDTLVQRQRDAREGRSSHDVQRRICCALFFYRDCISRVVVDRCRDPSPTVVDILMGSRKRDLTVTCREYSRDQCSGSSTIRASVVILFSIFLSIWLFKSNSIV